MPWDVKQELPGIGALQCGDWRRDDLMIHSKQSDNTPLGYLPAPEQGRLGHSRDNASDE